MGYKQRRLRSKKSTPKKGKNKQQIKMPAAVGPQQELGEAHMPSTMLLLADVIHFVESILICVCVFEVA